ncbi:heparinase II/III domain-containing protein, partial [Geminisphaera colitermitum]|uniref:heparinase II/III domain-containing protein n=1 Tax=Geminisphaera colitermitum TaxID=1148786 RepID=UPI000694285F
MRPPPPPRLSLFVCALSLALASAIASIAVAADKYPVFGHPDFSKPENWREVTAAEFDKTDPSRPAQIGAKRHPYASPDELRKLGEWFTDTADGRAAWKAETSFAAQIVNQWHLPKTGFAASRYVYSLRDLPRLSLVHLFTGHDLLGQFLKKHIAHIATLPPAFWLHSELRGNKADIETAQTGLAFATALAASPDLFSADEIASMDAALRTKALAPCLDCYWFKTGRTNNHTAIIATGALVMGRYLDDTAAQDAAVRRLRWYIDSTVEADGSYGEGIGYFYYPMDTLFSAALAMSPEQLDTMFSGAPLANSSRWLAHHYFLFRDKNATRHQPMRAHFHDNSYWGRPPASITVLFASLYNDDLARWLDDTFRNPSKNETEEEGGGEGRSWRSFLFLQKQRAGSKPLAKLPPLKTPAELGLPTIASFASGDNFIRSGWGDNGVVFALNNASATKTNYTHHHACRNSFVLAAFGEYLVGSPGSASYRSPLHLEYDMSTRAQNTIEIDGTNQLLPRNLQTKAMRQGQPVAKTTLLAAGKTADVLASDATGAYAQPHKRIGRVVVYARKPGYFVIFDRLESTGENHSYAWRLHLNNRDGRAALSTTEREGGGEGGKSYRYSLKRPKAALELFVAADTPLDASVGEGRMHGQSRDYSPGGTNEGKLGSAIELTVRNRESAANLGIVSVLRPVPVATPDSLPPPP